MIKHNIIYSNFLEYQFTLKKAEGSLLWTKEGRRLIDFTSGWNVTNLGWNHPEVLDAIIRQVKKNTYTSMWIGEEAQIALAEEFKQSLPKELSVFCRVTGGTEANEKALILARSLTRRKKIIGFRDTYHGQSFGTMSIGYRPEYAQDVAPLVPGFIQLDFPTTYVSGKSEKQTLDNFLSTLEYVLQKKDVAAIVTEAGIITGWGSTYIAPRGYLKAVRKLTQQYGTLLILDEVGTGFSRCGKLFGWELENVKPDIMTFAKGLTNGSGAMGAVVVSNRFSEKELSQAKTHSTFGWMPVECAAGRKVLEIHKRDRVWTQAVAKGAYLLTQLRKHLGDSPFVGNINGIGMEIGVTFVKDKASKTPHAELAKNVIARSFTKGLHLILGEDGNIQIMPPLTIPKQVLQEGLEIFVDAVGRAEKQA